jgi:hypothetical protein
MRTCGVRGVSARHFWACYHRTRRGWHASFQHGLNLSEAETVSLQLILGSDPHREALNLMRAIALRKMRVPQFWRERFNILYASKPD